MNLFGLVCILLTLTASKYGLASKSNRDTYRLTYRDDKSDLTKTEYYQAARRRAIDDLQKNPIPVDSCYQSDGTATKCAVSEFGNVALGKEVHASSTCGSPAKRFCRNTIDSYGTQMTFCTLCDANHEKRQQNPQYAVDSDNSTCWMSDQFDNAVKTQEISYQVSLGKTYEMTYVIMNFCNQIPESLALYKSSDNGRTWRPLQYYSSDCEGMYGVAENEVITHQNEQKAICQNVYRPNSSNARIAFSFHIGRPSAANLANSPILRDWITVTDIKIEFKRLDSKRMSYNGQSQNLYSGSERKSRNYYSLSEVVLGGRCKCNGHAAGCKDGRGGEISCDCKHNTEGQDCERCQPFFVDRPWKPATDTNANECVACQCNGHSERCVFNQDLYLSSGKLSGGLCVNCQHNTEGAHCQYCATGYQRNLLVAVSHPDACSECECHLHAKRCRFNHQLYLLSGQTSGGVCLNCRHNTDGVHCQYCKAGYFRDITKPDTHKKTCQECGCHPWGSDNKRCSEIGQCNCKEGVTGLKCSQCKPGYKMTRSTTKPCEKIGKTERDSTRYEPLKGESHPISTLNTQPETVLTEQNLVPEREDTCARCQRESAFLDLQKYCSSSYAITALVKSREKLDSDTQRFEIQIIRTFKSGGDDYKYSRVRRSAVYAYVKRADLKCKCPKLRVGRTYLMIGMTSSEQAEHDGFMLDRQSVVVPSRTEYESRIRDYTRSQLSGNCN